MEISDWDSISKKDVIYSDEFKIYGYTWCLEIRINSDLKDYISVFLIRMDAKTDFSLHIPMNQVFFVRNVKDYFCYQCKTLPTVYYSSYYNGWGHSLLIKKSKLEERHEKTYSKILEGNKFFIGVYFHIYKYKKEFYKNEMINTLFSETEKRIIKRDGFFEFKIENWKRLYSEDFVSPEIKIGDTKWKMKVNIQNAILNCSINCMMNIHHKPLLTKGMIFVRNCYDSECFLYRDIMDCEGYKTFKPYSSYELKIPIIRLLYNNNHLNKPIVKDYKCVIGLYIQYFGDEIDYPYGDKEIFNICNIYSDLRMEKDDGNSSIEKVAKIDRKKIENEIRENLEKELREKIEKEIRERVTKEEKEKIKKEVEASIKKENLNTPQKLNYTPNTSYLSYYPAPMYYPQAPSSVPVSSGQNPATIYYYPPANPNQSTMPVSPGQNPSVSYYYPPVNPPTNPSQSTMPVSPGQNPAPTYYYPPVNSPINPSQSTMPVSPGMPPPAGGPPPPGQNLAPTYYYPPANPPTNPSQSTMPASPGQNPATSYYYSPTNPPTNPSANTPTDPINPSQTPTAPYYYPPKDNSIQPENSKLDVTTPSSPPPSYY